jgi:DHA1 family inner membrane transport protein
MDQASTAPTLASAANIGAFNLGNALAAWLGGIVIAAGLGYTAPNWVGALLSGSALLLSLLAAHLHRRTRTPGHIVGRSQPSASAPVAARH